MLSFGSFIIQCGNQELAVALLSILHCSIECEIKVISRYNHISSIPCCLIFTVTVLRSKVPEGPTCWCRSTREVSYSVSSAVYTYFKNIISISNSIVIFYIHGKGITKLFTVCNIRVYRDNCVMCSRNNPHI